MRKRGLALVLVAACGSDDVDLTGVYRVDSAVGSEPCGADETIEFAAFVKFAKMELFGQPFFAYDGCTDAGAAECSSIGGLFGGFFEPIDNGWQGRSSFSAGGGELSCLLGLVDQTALLDGTRLTIEVSRFEEEVDGLTVDQCSPDEAEKRGEDMPCLDHSLIDTTKI